MTKSARAAASWSLVIDWSLWLGHWSLARLLYHPASRMRRYGFIVLFFIVLVAPFVVQRVVARGQRDDGSNVGSGDGPELVIVTPHNQDIRRTFARAFSDWHRERFGTAVRVTYLTPGGTNDIVRMLADTYGAMRDPATATLPPPERVSVSIDLVWGGGDTRVRARPQVEGRAPAGEA